jgi:predicted ATPase/DNA-binding SARP family transcriptional activator
VRTGVRIAVLGPILVEDAGGRLSPPPGATTKALVVALALAPGGALSVRGLVDDIWADNPPRNEKAALQTLVSRLRAATADDLLVSASNGYRLAATGALCDIGAAASYRDEARAALENGDAAGAARAASAGLALWRGEPGADLGDLELADRLAATAARLNDDLTRGRAAARVELGDHLGALADIEQLLAASPLDEDLQLMRLTVVAASGRRNDAIRLFAEFRERLRDELGTGPSAALTAFNAELLREEDAPPRPARVQFGLRTPPNALVGRDDDVAALVALVRESRLTTILGAGGLGKTRVAQEVARASTAHTPAVIFVELASVRSGEDVPLVLASALGIREASGARLKLSDPGVRLDVRSRILNALIERPTLLVMDNCEHLVDAAAEWIGDILDSTTTVHILATSRSPLMISAERVYPLDSLSGSSETGEPAPAVALFMERARAARPSATLPLETVARLCDRLDGLPLAIELAAARVRSMSVEEIERRIGNRFTLLRGGDRTAPERHRTLLAVIDWSWNLLGESERRTMRRLSRFVDGFSAEAAQIVAAGDDAVDIADDLDALVNQSLVSVSEHAATGSVRYRMLETVREFGDMALVDAGEDVLVADATYRWAAGFCADVAEVTYGPEQVPTFHRVELEQENLVSTLRAAIDESRADVIVRIFTALGLHWSLRGAHSEVIGFGVPILTATRNFSPGDGELDAAALTYAIIGGSSMFSDQRTGIRALARLRVVTRGKRLADPQSQAMVDLLMLVSDPPAAFRLLAELRESHDPSVSAFAHLISAQFAENDGDIPTALRYSQASFERAASRQDTWTQGTAAQSLAQLYSQVARPEEALEWAAKARPMLASLLAADDLRQLDWLVAVNEVSLGRLDRARDALSFIAYDTDSTGFDAADLRTIGLGGLAEIAALTGDVAEARRIYRAAFGAFTLEHGEMSPWSLMVGSAYVALSTVSGHAAESEVAEAVVALRQRIRVSVRLRPQFTDRPILGAAILGIALWLLEPERPGATAEDVAVGLELLGLSRALYGRQDLLTLHWQPAADRVSTTHGAEAVAAAVASAESREPAARSERALDLLRGPNRD